MDEKAFSVAILATNQRLKEARTRVEVRLKGKTLRLRANLPVKPGKGVGRKQDEICLGIPASGEGLKEMERRAHELHKQMVHGTFSWNNWQQASYQPPDEVPAGRLIEQFKKHYQQKHEIKDSTWDAGWARTLQRLPQDAPLDAVIIMAVVQTTTEHTETRKRTCQRLQALADYAGIEVDLSHYAGKYGRQSLNPREIPSDELVKEWRDRISNKSWRWIYGMIATFGLRPHEAFFCEFTSPYSVRVPNEIAPGQPTKTGSHIAWAVHPEWVADWNLMEVHRPNVTGKTPSDYGNRNKRQFQRYKVPFPAYNLRHAYAVRVSALGGDQYVSPSIAAKWMGHSEAVHNLTYHHWISDQVSEDVYRRRVLKKLD